MSIQTPADIAAKYLDNVDEQNALRQDIEDLYEAAGAAIRSGCATVVINSQGTTNEEIATDVLNMQLPDLTSLT